MATEGGGKEKKISKFNSSHFINETEAHDLAKSSCDRVKLKTSFHSQPVFLFFTKSF